MENKIVKRAVGHWRDVKNQKSFMLSLGQKLGYKSMEDWYNISAQDFIKNSGGSLLFHYDYSPKLAVNTIFKHHEWDNTQFRATLGFWLNFENQKNYLTSLGQSLGYQCMEDWYKITAQDFVNHGGTSLLSNYSGSPPKIIQTIFHYHNWNPEKFRLTHGYWQDIGNHKKYLTNLGKKLGFKSMEDWYKISHQDFMANSGSSLILKYNGSPQKVVITVFEEHTWDTQKFRPFSGYWNDVENHKRFMISLGNKLGFKSTEDWYKISTKVIVKNGGRTLLAHYNGYGECLIKLFPEVNWMKWLFRNKKGRNEGVNYIKWLTGNVKKWAEILNIQKQSEWYSVDIFYEIKQKKLPFGEKIMKEQSNLHDVLKLAFPNYNWDFKLFRKFKNEELLAQYIHELFPNTGVFCCRHVVSSVFSRDSQIF